MSGSGDVFLVGSTTAPAKRPGQALEIADRRDKVGGFIRKKPGSGLVKGDAGPAEAVNRLSFAVAGRFGAQSKSPQRLHRLLRPQVNRLPSVESRGSNVECFFVKITVRASYQPKILKISVLPFR